MDCKLELMLSKHKLKISPSLPPPPKNRNKLLKKNYDNDEQCKSSKDDCLRKRKMYFENKTSTVIFTR